MQVITEKSKTAFLLVIGFMYQINVVKSQEQNKPFQNKYLGNKNTIGMEISVAVLPKATITRTEGNYELMSKTQSSYDLGILYIHRFDSSIKVVTGLHFVVGKWNYFAIIPASDFPPNMNITNEAYLEHKFLWNKFRVPLILEKTLFKKNRKQLINLLVGMDLSFFPFEVNFEGNRHVVRGSNNQSITVMEEEILRTNNKKPWMNYLVGLSKNFPKRQNLSVGIEANFSSANFINGTYLITMPGKPQTSGSYTVNGTGCALKVQYIFGNRKASIH